LSSWTAGIAEQEYTLLLRLRLELEGAELKPLKLMS
jgi:hypothetical protein